MSVYALRAFISLIPKEGKGPAQCGSYHPIALLNTDLKLFAKILPNRLLPHLPSLIHKDQAGFVPLLEPCDNSIRVINLIHATLEPFLCKVCDDPNITGYYKSLGRP